MPEDDPGHQAKDAVNAHHALEPARRDAVVFAWFVPPGQEELGEYYLALLRSYHPDSKLFVGMNHGSDPVWEERFAESGLDAAVRWARPEIGDYWDATGFLTALEAFHDSDGDFALVWFGHTKGGSRPFGDYVHVRAEQEREFWARRDEIARFFADPAIGLFAPRYNLTPPYPFPGPWRGWTDELASLQRVYRDRFAPLGLCALDTFFVLRGAVVRRFCEATGDAFFRTDPGAYGANKWFFEMAFPSIAAMQGFAPFVDREVTGDDDPRDDLMISRDVKQIHRLAAAEVARWRDDPFGFVPRVLPWDRPAWQWMTEAGGGRREAGDAPSPPTPSPMATGEGLPGTELSEGDAERRPMVVDHRVEGRGWLRAPETGAWQPVAGAGHEGLRIVLDEPVTSPFRVRLTLTASGMEALRLTLSGEGAGGRWVRNAWLDVGRPGALHHELRRVGLYANPTLRYFALELEEALGEGESLAAIALSPADAELRDVAPHPPMAIHLHEARVAKDWPVGPPVRFVPDWLDGSVFPKRRPDGTRDAVIFAWFVPERMPELGKYYLNLLRYYHVDSKLFVGMNHGSDPVWEGRLRDSGLDAAVRWARPEIGDYWDATGFLTALEGFHDSDEEFALVWFGHTKGASGAHHTDYHRNRVELQRNYWARRNEITGVFDDPEIGLFARRFAPWWEGICGRELPALTRVYREDFAPLGMSAFDTFFVMRGAIVRRFCDSVTKGFFTTSPGEYGANRWFFEMAFPSVATMQGYVPFVDMTVDGGNDPRADVWLRDDPRQNHRIVAEELERWRLDPVGFTPRRLREFPEPWWKQERVQDGR